MRYRGGWGIERDLLVVVMVLTSGTLVVVLRLHALMQLPDLSVNRQLDTSLPMERTDKPLIQSSRAASL